MRFPICPCARSRCFGRPAAATYACMHTCIHAYMFRGHVSGDVNMGQTITVVRAGDGGRASEASSKQGDAGAPASGLLLGGLLGLGGLRRLHLHPPATSLPPPLPPLPLAPPYMLVRAKVFFGCGRDSQSRLAVQSSDPRFSLEIRSKSHLRPMFSSTKSFERW